VDRRTPGPTDLGDTLDSVVEPVEREQRSHPRAYESLFAEYARGMHFVLHRQGIGYWEAAELAQEAWAIALARMRRGKERDPALLGPYLCGIARRLASNLRRKIERQRTTADSDLIDLFAADTDPPEHAVGRAQNAEIVWRVLGSLRSRDRDVLEHFCLGGADKDEVCMRLGISPARFHGILFRAKERFHRQLRKTAGGRELEREHD
jgi:RNA polymerase sigma-70 factor (ECF subfamily)